jgi:DNA-binding CsgD family transcriptional regulator
VIFSNHVANLILQDAHGLRLAIDRLVAIKRDDDLLLQRLLQEAISTEIRKDQTITISRTHAMRPLVVQILRYRSQEAFGFLKKDAAMILLLQDPERKIEIDQNIVAHLYGLTAAQARIATALVSGNTIAEICVSLGITRNTAKTLLRRTFLRMGAKSQSDLVRIILCGVAHMASNVTSE